MPEAAPSPAVAVHQLGHRFADVTALQGLNGAFQRRQMTALLGANGSGKTTLLRLLGGHLAPSEGRLDHDLHQRSTYLTQRPALDPEMTVLATLSLFATLQGIPKSRRGKRLQVLNASLSLQDLQARRVHQLSGGQRQRLHLAVGLLAESELLLLDEPGTGLDQHGRQALWSTLRQRADEGAAVVVVSHDLAAVREHADQAWLLEAGRLVVRGPASEILDEHQNTLATAATAAENIAGTQPPGRGRRPGTGGGRRGRGKP